MTSVARICGAEGCTKRHYARGYCNPHYQRHMSGRQIEGDFRKTDPGRGCKASGCRRPHGQNGYCQAHNKRVKSGKSLDTPIQIRRKYTTCLIPGCRSPHWATGMCSKHDRACRNFNLTLVQYLSIQDAGCGICGGRKKTLHIDHDHACCPQDGKSCGKCVRGGLCPNCNVGLGMFGDNPDRLRGAIDYLRRNGIVE